MNGNDSTWTSLSTDEFFLLWFAHYKVRGFPYFFGTGPVGRSRTDREARTASAGEALRLRGLGTIEAPVADLMEIIEVLAEAPVRVELAYTGGSAPILRLAAVNASRAAVVARFGSEVRLRTDVASNIQADLTDSVPAMEAGAGEPANVRTADFEEAAEAVGRDGRRTPRDVLEETGMRRGEMATVLEVLEADACRGTVAVKRREDGRREDGTEWRYSPLELSWTDTTRGRYAVRGANGWTTIVPTDRARLDSMLAELLAELDPPR